MRDYASLSIEELEELFSSNLDNEAVLRKLLRELKNKRTTRRAKALLSRVLAHLGEDAATSYAPGDRKKRRKERSRHAPTAEQIECVERFRDGQKLKITAFAGSGKTTTLRLLSESTNARGIYLAFNRKTKDEARESFPKSVACKTTHGVAYQSLIGHFSHDKLTGKMNSIELAEFIGLRDVQLGPARILRARSFAFLIKETVRRFSHSCAPSIDDIAIPRPSAYKSLRNDAWQILERYVQQYARLVWSRMCEPSDAIPLGFDGYLKLWALSKPRIVGDFILLDEAQDTNPVVLDVVENQAPHSQIVYVGDEHQQIYEWRGAVNAMQRVSTSHERYLTKSFRFGAAVADAATAILRHLGESRALVGNENIQSIIGAVERPDAILCRSNASCIAELINAIDHGLKPCLVGGTDELVRLTQGVQKLKAGEQTDAPELIGFINWNEVLELVNAGEAEHLRTLVGLVENRSEKQILWALRQTVSEEQATVTVSTAHKAKGREWSSVRVADDFVRSFTASVSKHGGIPDAEARLFYVAVTRAKERLDVDPALLGMFNGQIKRLQTPTG